MDAEQRLTELLDQFAQLLNLARADKQPQTPTDLYSVRQASRMTKITEATIYDWIQRGIVPAYGRHQCYRVSLTELMPRIKPRRAGTLRPGSYPAQREKNIRLTDGAKGKD